MTKWKTAITHSRKKSEEEKEKQKDNGGDFDVQGATAHSQHTYLNTQHNTHT